MSSYITYIALSLLWIVVTGVVTWMLVRSAKPVETFIDSKMAVFKDSMKRRADTDKKSSSPSLPVQPESPPPDPEALPPKVKEVITGTYVPQNIGGGTAIADVLGDQDLKNVPDAKIRCVFEPVSELDAVSSLALAEAVRIHEVKLETVAKNKFVVSLKVENLTKELITAHIPKGQVFENKMRGTGVQNLASWDLVAVELPPREIVDLRVNALCINRDWDPPKGEDGNITVLKIKDDDFKEQKDLWSTIEDAIRSYQQRTGE